MKMKWSPSVEGFFCDNSSNTPDDAFKIDDDLYIALMNGQSAGKLIVNNQNNYPILIDYPPKTKEQESNEAENARQVILNKSNEFINNQQWPSKLMLGRLSEGEKQLFNEWLDYLDALKEIDVSGAPDILWPIPPAERAS
ncbi:tail fiber assembly protein [Siccibacter turicensis]|uniref:Phage tail protein n=1 Tax=Siccibacter turicensis TaxID=357233 RepID=A0A2P8VE61_9ENTR|nr:tail fiber assembly protein [Siccibacter turicensis]PSN05835.1 phage tail protein [Siccibacter turicensis]